MPFPITLPEQEVADSLDRFLSRLLRRDMFEQLSKQEQPETPDYDLVLFGSVAVQASRPPQGYPIRRFARDIDVGITTDKRESDPRDEERAVIGQSILNAIDAIGATVVEGSMKGVPGYDGLMMEKTYTRAEIEEHLTGRLEAESVRRHLSEHQEYTTKLELEEA